MARIGQPSTPTVAAAKTILATWAREAGIATWLWASEKYLNLRYSNRRLRKTEQLGAS
jgi:hypothetical protein